MEGENNKGSIHIDIQEPESGTIHIDIQEPESGTIHIDIQEPESGTINIDIQEPESWIDKLKQGREPRKYKNSKTSDGVSIYRVPESIKKSNQKAYDPLVLFLGPFHHKKEQEMTVMDEYKLQAVDSTLERIRGMNRKDLVAKVRELVPQIRECYEDRAIEWDGDTLSWIMTLDACFILEFLRMDLADSSLLFWSQRVDNVKRREIIMDILKMENQIPLRILKKILKLEVSDPVAFLAERLNNSMGSYFRGFPFKGKDLGHIEKVIEGHIKEGAFHLLDLSRRVIADVLSNGVARSTRRWWWDRHLAVDTSMIPSAKKLQEAGIQLERGEVHFERRFLRSGKLYLPRISIYDNTEIFLRNLIALEECQRRTGSQTKRPISRHVRMMNHLIDSREDVGLFREAKIIKNLLGSDKEAAKMFNALCVEITNDDEFKDILGDVNEHYNSKLKVWMSEFRKDYCSTPWYAISLVAAVILLVLTLLQTIYTMESYFES